MLETEFRLRHPDFESVSAKVNITLGEGLYKHYIINSVPQPWIMTFDTVCTAILSAEFILKLMVNSERKSFMKHPLNIADLIGLLPMWLHFIITLFMQIANYNSNWLQGILDTLSFFRLFRTLRFARMMMMNKQLRIVFLALAHSWQELLIMSFVILVTSSIFGSIIYYVGLSHDNFKTVFHGMWWAIVTMTTVGYGDYFPVSGFGYFIGVICSLCGIILIALATTIIVNHFLVTYAAVEVYERSRIASSDMTNKGRKSQKYIASINLTDKDGSLEEACQDVISTVPSADTSVKAGIKRIASFSITCNLEGKVETEGIDHDKVNRWNKEGKELSVDACISGNYQKDNVLTNIRSETVDASEINRVKCGHNNNNLEDTSKDEGYNTDRISPGEQTSQRHVHGETDRNSCNEMYI